MSAAGGASRWRQSAAMRDLLLAAAGPGRFAVPQCSDCGHRFYPPQSWCPKCLGSGITLLADAGAATVLSMTELHISFDAVYKSRLPLHVACVRTESGISLFALADQTLASGSRVVVQAVEASDGMPALWHVVPVD